MRDKAIEIAKRLTTDSIWKSANLEGLGTTFQKTEAILANATTKTTMEEVLFIVNMNHAWQLLLDNLEYPNLLSIIREFNRIAGNMMFYGNGEIRTLPVSIGGTKWEPEKPQEGVIIRTIDELNEISDQEMRALKYFCFIARAQIFIDGNKRVAQLIANKILIENDIGIFQIDIEDLETFKGLLLEFYENDDDTKIISFMQHHCVKRCAVSYDEM